MLSCNHEVVSELHVRVMRLVARTAEAQLVPRLWLDGGTALAAYYLGHRQSEDLDFFGDLDLNALAFGEAARRSGAEEGLDFEPIGRGSLTFARFMVRDEEGSVKVDLAANSPYRLEPFQPTTEGIQVAAFRDLIAGKLHAICDRFAERDFVDLHAILTRTEPGLEITDEVVRSRFRSVVKDLMEIDPGLGPHHIGEGVARGLHRPIIAGFPLQLLVPLSEEEIKRTVGLCVEEAARMVAEQEFGR